MNNKTILVFIRENKWIVLATFFFIIWKFLLIHVMWDGRSVPPEPDDSYAYIANIASISDCDTGYSCDQQKTMLVSDYSSHVEFSYKLIFGTLARVLSLSPEATYHLSFYLGTLGLLVALIIFLKSLTENRTLIALSLFFLALNHGSGEVHGFYWVVPSFFSTLLFFLLVAYIFDSAKNYKKFLQPILLTPIFILMHPLSVYFLLIIPFYFFFHFVLTRQYSKKEYLKYGIILIFAAITLIAQTISMAKDGQSDPYGINATLPRVLGIVGGLHTPSNMAMSYDITPPSESKQQNTTYLNNRLATMNAAYFRWFFPHWLIIIPFLFCLSLLYIKKEYKVIALYGATLIFFVLSTIMNQFGFRSAIVLWPVTFIFFAFSIYYIFVLIRNKINKNVLSKLIIYSFLVSGVSLFIVLNMTYALVINSNLNARSSFTINKSYEQYLLKKTTSEDTLYIPRLLRQASFDSPLYSRNRIIYPTEFPKYIVWVNIKTKTSPMSDQLELSATYLLKTLHLGNLFSVSSLAHDDSSSLPSGYRIEKSFGDILILKLGY